MKQTVKAELVYLSCTSREIPFYFFYPFCTFKLSCLLNPLQVSAATAQSMTCLKTVPYLGCGGSCTVFRSRWGSQMWPSNHRNNQPNPPSLSSPQHTQGRPGEARFLTSLPAHSPTSSPSSSVTVYFSLTRKHAVPLISACPCQAGAEGRADSSVPDVPPCSSAPLDRGGGFAAQDATSNWPPGEEWPDLHTPAHAHRQGPQTAGGG